MKLKLLHVVFFISFSFLFPFLHQFGNYEALLHVNLLFIKKKELFNFTSIDNLFLLKNL